MKEGRKPELKKTKQAGRRERGEVHEGDVSCREAGGGVSELHATRQRLKAKPLRREQGVRKQGSSETGCQKCGGKGERGGSRLWQSLVGIASQQEGVCCQIGGVGEGSLRPKCRVGGGLVWGEVMRERRRKLGSAWSLKWPAAASAAVLQEADSRSHTPMHHPSQTVRSIPVAGHGRCYRGASWVVIDSCAVGQPCARPQRSIRACCQAALSCRLLLLL